MIMLAILTTLAGAVLGIRFKVLILLPATAIGLAVIIVLGLARAESIGNIVLPVVVLVTSLQVGYLCGIGIRYLLFVGPRRGSAWRQPSRSLTESTR